MAKTITKADVVKAIQDENGYSKKQSIDIVETLLEIIKGTLESGEDVLLSGFGKFHVRSKRARKGRNPGTGDDLILPERRVVRFRCSDRLKDRINGG
ncbi:MAG: integration host factor subunit alpha [Desulfobacteraceae bacterium]|nr:MAG: integration host factor subunit alpha [Desulfobacteraceae bacterium]